jgi:hypothetical protein
MIDIALDPFTNDLVFKDFDFDLVDDTKQIMQNLAIRLRFVLGEWYLDITQGIPYFEFFFIKAPNLIQIESILKEEIVNTRGIVELISFESDYEARRRIFSVKFSARSISGEELLKELEIPV